MKRYFSFSTKIYLFALALRLVPVLLTYDLVIGLDDMFQYDMLALNIAAGNGFRWYGAEMLALYQRYAPFEFILPQNYHPDGVLTSFRAPAYPTFLAMIYFFASPGRRWFVARIFQAVIGAALAPLTFHLAKFIFPAASKTHKIAGSILAIYPMLLIYPIGLATENLFFPLFLASTVVLILAGERKSMKLYLLAGLLFGMTALTRSVVIAVIPMIMLWLWFGYKQRRAALFFPVIIALVISPWAIRNSMLHNKVTLVETSMGYNLHMGYHPESAGTFKYGVSLELLPYIDDMERDELGREMAWGYITENPIRIPELMARKLGHFFALETRPLIYFYSNDFFGAIPLPLLVTIFLFFALPFVLLMAFSIVGGVLTSWDNPARIMVGVIAFAYLLPHLLIMAEPRFHMALIPFFAIFAAYGWTHRRQILTLQSGKRALFILLMGILFLNWGLALWQDADRLALIFGPAGNQSYFEY